MRVLKETYKRCAHQIISRPIPQTKNNSNVSRERLVAVQKFFIQNDPARIYAPFITADAYYLNLAEDCILNFLGPRKKEISLESYRKFVHIDGKKDFNPKNPSEPKKPLPRLLYFQNPLVWMSNKLDFRYLRMTWDPNFNEPEFTRGARQAVSTVTSMLSKNMFDNMKPLLTKNALLNLRRDVEILWADEVRRNIALQPEDVQLILPRKLHFRHSSEPKLLESELPSTYAIINAKLPQKNIPERKYCDIDVLFIGLKWLEDYTARAPPLIFVDIIARFHRNYSEGISPDWTISVFKVRRFNLIPQKYND